MAEAATGPERALAASPPCRHEVLRSAGRHCELVELSPDAILVARSGRITFVNAAAVELLGGSVHATSAGADQGAEFVVRLPLAQLPAPTAAAKPEARPASSRPVLIIEDSVDTAETLREALTVFGHRVHVATDGTSGLAEARRRRPEVVLCDIGLPDIDGYQVARALRPTRLVALTGYALPEDRERAAQAGFDAHLAKPAPLDALADLLAGG